MYKFAERVAIKLIHQTDSPDPDLRQLVGHSHLLDAVAPYLIDDDEYLRETAVRTPRRAQASPLSETWSNHRDTVDDDVKDSDSDGSDDSERDWDEAIVQMADAVYVEEGAQKDTVPKLSKSQDLRNGHRRPKAGADERRMPRKDR